MAQTVQSIEIVDLAYGGEGVGRMDGKAVFVPGTIPGEIVDITLTENRKRFARGALASVQKPSPSRCEPVCPLAGHCVGCSYQHISYDQEVAWKQTQLVTLLTRIGKLSSVPTCAAIASPAPLSYRNKIVLHADGNAKLGYRGADNRTILDVPDCPLAVEPIRAALASFRDAHLNELIAGDRITFRWTDTDGVTQWVNDHAPRKDLTETVNGTQWLVPVGGFWQVNVYAAPLLLDKVTDMLAGCDIQYLIDMYCGSGFFTLAQAGHAEHVLGIERDAHAIRAAERTAALQGKKQVRFVQGHSGDLYPEAQACVEPERTLVLVDPPRRGLDASMLHHIIEPEGPHYLLYVSCAADTLARDCKALTLSYDIKEVAMVDMFPQTAHFESVILFEKRA